VTVATVQCRFKLEVPHVDDEGQEQDECGGEIEIEWELVRGELQPNGIFLCDYCGEEKNGYAAKPCEDFEGDEHTEHKWSEQYEEGPETLELISYKTYCWHSLTREEAKNILDDEAVAYEELRTERIYEG
jgi:hypothetical protein